MVRGIRQGKENSVSDESGGCEIHTGQHISKRSWITDASRALTLYFTAAGSPSNESKLRRYWLCFDGFSDVESEQLYGGF